MLHTLQYQFGAQCDKAENFILHNSRLVSYTIIILSTLFLIVGIGYKFDDAAMNSAETRLLLAFIFNSVSVMAFCAIFLKNIAQKQSLGLLGTTSMLPLSMALAFLVWTILNIHQLLDPRIDNDLFRRYLYSLCNNGFLFACIPYIPQRPFFPYKNSHKHPFRYFTVTIMLFFSYIGALLLLKSAAVAWAEQLSMFTHALSSLALTVYLGTFTVLSFQKRGMDFFAVFTALFFAILAIFVLRDFWLSYQKMPEMDFMKGLYTTLKILFLLIYLVFAVSELFDYIESAMVEQRKAVRHRLKNDIGIIRLQINDLVSDYEWSNSALKENELLTGLKRLRDINLMGMSVIYELLTIDTNSSNHSINALALINKMLENKENALHISLSKTLNSSSLSAIRLNMSAAQRFFILLDELITNAYKNNDDKHEIAVNIDNTTPMIAGQRISVKISHEIDTQKQYVGGMQLGKEIIENSVSLLGGKIEQNEQIGNRWIVHISNLNLS